MTSAVERAKFQWWPDRQLGFYPVEQVGQYDQAYWDKYVEYSKTPFGRALTDARLALTSRFCVGAAVVDIGVGCGQFLSARGLKTFGYDVNTAGIRWLLDNNVWWDPWAKDPDVITCWDSLEHLVRPHELIARVKTHVLVSLPIFRDKDHALASKHFRPDEHCWYWTRDGFVRWMSDLGFRLLEENKMESDLGREDIGTFVFGRA